MWEISELEKLLQESRTIGLITTDASGRLLCKGERDALGKIYATGLVDRATKRDYVVKCLNAAPSLAAELLELKLRDRWIPCEEKKPLMGELVSLWLPYGAMHQGYFGCDGKFHLCISGRIADEAIAWRPLPSPPIATQVAG